MPRYRLMVPVKEASGRQFYTVDAADEADALDKWLDGKAEYEDEELEVTSVGDRDEVEVDELDDE